MSRSRFWSRSLVAARAVAGSFRRRPLHGSPRRVLVAHHPQMLGDVFMLAPLFAKIRQNWPQAETVMITSGGVRPLFNARPWGVEAVEYDPRDSRTLGHFRRPGGYDLAIVPGDNRYGLFSRAVGARWVLGFSGDRPAYKNLFIDHATPFPDAPDTWGEMAADLIPGPDAAAFRVGDWPAPPHAEFERPRAPYAVLHLGASTPLKLWPPQRWAALAAALSARGFDIAWSAGPGEQPLVDQADPGGKYTSYAGRLDLAQLWHLLAGASLLVSPDTGISHMSRATGTPTVALFGPGTHVVAGLGTFWRDNRWKAVLIEPFECRDQRVLFKRPVQWVRRCQRSTRECAEPRCMNAIGLDLVLAAIDEVMAKDPR
jgi:ADP-heptose:LPS heptosyltransferase